MSEPAKRYYKTFSDNMHLQAENARLKAEVERLTRAGNEVIREWGSGDETEARNFMKALAIWLAAKERKPSV